MASKKQTGKGKSKSNGNGGRKAIRELQDGSVEFARAVRRRTVARFSAEQKTAAVRAVLSGAKTRSAVALSLGTYPGVISRWAMDKRFGGVAGGLSGRGVAAFVPEPATKGANRRNGK